MSTPRYRIHPKVISLLHERGVTVERLAALAGTGRAHATQVLANKPGRGYRTRARLAGFLTLRELDLLGWEEVGQLPPMSPVRVHGYDGPFGRVQDVKHYEFSTGNVPTKTSA
jgi:hypothetical protein